MLSDLLYRLRAIFRRNRMEEELDAEVRAHFERQVEVNLQRGLSPPEARRQARLALGSVEEVKEECRDAWGISFIETTLQDIRYAVRTLRRQPGLVASATLSTGLGIGVCTVVFGLVHLAMFQPLPAHEPGRLMAIAAQQEGPGAGGVSCSGNARCARQPQ
jgi:putative ABC transport system permease protein